MQTFLPYPEFKKSAQVLDRQRLGKQRLECVQILETTLGLSQGWKHHPAVAMWENHSFALLLYGIAICEEWRRRGYKDRMLCSLVKLFDLAVDRGSLLLPSWLEGPIHATHRAALLHKDFTHYSQFGWSEEPQLAYYWPERI